MSRNKVTEAVIRMDNQIQERINAGIVTVGKVEETRKALDMDMEEYCRFQEIKSLAVAGGMLTLDEGMSIYTYLGSSPADFNRNSAAIKAVLTQIFKELLERIPGRGCRKVGSFAMAR